MYCNNYKCYNTPQIIKTAYMCFFVQYNKFNISVLIRDRQNDFRFYDTIHSSRYNFL